MPRQGRATALPEQLEAAIEESGRSLQAVGADAARGELEGQRDAVDLAADVGDGPCFGVAEHRAVTAGRDALDEELGGRIVEQLPGADGQPFRRRIERAQRIDVLALGAQRFAAGRQDADLRRFPDDGLRQRRQQVDDMLAAVEDQQHLAIVEMVDDAGREVVRLHHQSQRRSRYFGDVVVRAAQSEVEKAHAVAESLGLLVRGGESDGRLADAARSVDGDEAVGGQQLGYGAQIQVTP